MKKRTAILLLFCLLLGLCPIASGENIVLAGTVQGGSLHMRKSPNSSADIIETLKKGTELTILENDGTWCKVQKGKRSGYVMAQYLSIKGNYPHLGWGKAAGGGQLLNLYQAPDLSSKIIYKAADNMAVELVEKTGDWYKVRFGSSFGYIPQSQVSPLDGSYTLGLSIKADETIDANKIAFAPRLIGNPRAMLRQEGEFTYTILWPETGHAAADRCMQDWIEDTLALFEADYASYHSGAKAHCQIEYQAQALDNRYQSVLLLAEYTVGSLKVDKVLTVNLDLQTGELVSASQLLSSDRNALFILEMGIAALMQNPTDGYTGKADAAALSNALLTRDGLIVYLPAGRYLPDSMGIQKILIPWEQIAKEVRIESKTIAAHQRKIDPNKPMIALTFDDGPSQYTKRILDTLAKYGGKATFCVVGPNVELYPNTVRRAVAEGHEIANHTWNHKKLTELSASSIRTQLQKTNDLVYEITGGYQIKVLRPPYGSNDKTVRSICAEMDLVIAHWKIDTRDWSTRSKSKTYRSIINEAENGAIILCHDLYETTAQAVEEAIPKLIEKGYQLVTVSELLSFHKDGVKPGTVYSQVKPENIKKD